ncbi:MAG: co-chaperone GroES [Fibrobacterota bacterium]|jgi:co-chaperonin GroES (HSP10)
MSESEKEMIVLGDRVLIAPAHDTGKTTGGLYLPQGVEKKNTVKSGIIVKTGPGYLIPTPIEKEDWHDQDEKPRYIPLEVQEGDYAIFLKKDAVEIEYEEKKYLILPQSSILTIVRDRIFSNL